MTQEFGDFDEDDAYDDQLALESIDIDWDAVQRLQNRYDEVEVIPDPVQRKAAAKALVRELNGEDSGAILVT